MEQTLRDFVWLRADATCEYCRMPQKHDDLPFQVDHIIAEKHNGATAEDNLALSCYYDNSYKGSNIAGLDPDTGKLTALFHPRRDVWVEHFAWDGAEIVGRTASGRVTVHVLRLNLDERVTLRQALINEGVYPPQTN